MLRNVLACAFALSIASPVFATDYVQAPGSGLAFAGKYQGEVFTGKFPGFTTKMSFDPQQLATSRLEVTIPLATASTGSRTMRACRSRPPLSPSPSPRVRCS